MRAGYDNSTAMAETGRDTCGGGSPFEICVVSTSKGQMYLSVLFSALAKLQSYILLSSSDDRMVYDSYTRQN